MTYEIVISFVVLLLAIILFSTEKIRADLTAILIMILLPWTNVITVEEAFSGLSSNAVITIIAVMIMGYGIEKSGAMDSVAAFITKKAASEEKKAILYISATVGSISSFMQNIGAVALFLPVAKKISRNIGSDPKKILMPMGFAGILGGTLTMIASGPLIILNDLLGDSGHHSYHLFSVTPIGLALLGAGLLYFYFFRQMFDFNTKDSSEQQDHELTETFNKQNPLNGKTVENEVGPAKKRKYFAMFSLALAIGLVLAGFPLSLSFVSGAALMVACGAVGKNEIYQAVDWRTVFLLAGLIPLGIAFEKSGAAALTATMMMKLIADWPDILILLMIGIVASFFSLFMSNVAATVLLVPVVVAMSSGIGMEPRALALLVAVSVSNSFIIPTHQVNAYIKGPGQYSNPDFMKAGSLMSLIFLVVSVTMIYFFY